MSQNELLYLLALQGVPQIGDIRAKKLIAHCGSAEAVFKTPPNKLLRIDGVGQLTLRELKNSVYLKMAEEELSFLSQNDIECVTFTDETYPFRLKHCVDSPIVLFKSGNIDFKNFRMISIVGTRNMTSYGKSFCMSIVEKIAPFNPVIISGFAYGVDITAHKAALDHGLQTIGCLAHGLNQMYPKVHLNYVEDVEKNGGFISEFRSSSKIERENFLKRNRIIAGMSQACIVIESGEKGGSLVTADIANSYDRDVFAVPGRASDKMSRGCNNLIKTNRAHLLSDPMDIPYMLNWDIEEESKKEEVVKKQLFVELSPEEKTLHQYLEQRKKEFLDVIALECGFPVFKTTSLLLQMELKGVVRPLPGKMFEAV